MLYRRDIDGLRAVAIIPVVFYHFGVPGFSGGFIGVDIFFVISGYLISSLLFEDIRNSRFSFVSFYSRRVRRLGPALIVVLIATTAMACLLLMPIQLVGYASDLLWTSFFSSNIWFLKKSGYFDVLANARILLHTWSLSVEEQFYLIAPLVFYLTMRRPVALLSLTIILLIISVYCAEIYPQAAFYLIFFRAWELLCGALLAEYSAIRLPEKSTLAVSILSMTVLALTLYFYDRSVHFPGIGALVPCLATAALLKTGLQPDPPLVNRILSRQPLVYIGQLSYPLYLWHWPVLTIAKYGLFIENDVFTDGALIALCVALSAMTVRFVESPVRQKVVLKGDWALFSTAGLVLGGFVIVSQVISVNRGFPGRVTEQGVAFERQAEYHADAYCARKDPRSRGLDLVCQLGPRERGASPSFLVWGDSHAEAMAPAFASLADARQIAGILFARGGCPGLVDTEASFGSSAECRDFNRQVVEEITRTTPRTVFLVGRWRATAALNHGSTFAAHLRKTVEFLAAKGLQVYVVEDVPEQSVDIPEALAWSATRGKPFDALMTARADYLQRNSLENSLFEQLQGEKRITFLKVETELCDERKCFIERDGAVIYRDSHHLSPFGALLTKPAFSDAFDRMSALHDGPRAASSGF